MMGTHQPQTELFSYHVNLEKRIRPDHPLRRFRELLDLSFVHPTVAKFYGSKGHVGTDPVILVKMMLLLFLDDVASERELVDVIAERLDYLWFLGYGLDDPIPNHSVLSKARARWGHEVFQDLFVRTVQQCVAAGLVDGKKLHIDSSLVRANAAKKSLTEASPELLAALREAYQLQEQKLDEPPSAGINAAVFSTTDPEATLARSSTGLPAQLAYKHHRTVDDAQGVVTAVATTTGNGSDAAELAPLISQHELNTQAVPKTVVGDKHYGTSNNYRYCQSRSIRAHLGRADPTSKELFGVRQFVYEADRDRYRCPADKYLYYHNFNKEKQLVKYKIEDASLCAQCALRSQCTRSEGGRTVTRPTFTELVEAAREQAESPAAMADLIRRRHRMEGSFADASNNHGFKRARWRGLQRQRLQDYLIAAIQNLRILIRKGSNRRNAAQMRISSIFAHCSSLVWMVLRGLPARIHDPQA